jgi:hypothetical protein
VHIIEMFSTEMSDDGMVSGVIRPAAVLPEGSARAVLRELADRDVRLGGYWLTEPTLWKRWDQPWSEAESPGPAELIGSIQVAYGTPSRYEITIYRATITQLAVATGWTVQLLCNEALGFGGLDLDNCPRADLKDPPRPFRMPRAGR